MDAWSTIIRLIEDELVQPEEIDRVEAIVRSAALARITAPRQVVGEAVMDRLEAGVPMAAALDLVEELVAIRHNRMLIEAGRRGIADEGDEGARVLLWPSRRSHPTFAA